MILILSETSSLKLFSSEDILEFQFSTRFRNIDIHGISDIDIDDIPAHFFASSKTPFIGCLLYLRDPRET